MGKTFSSGPETENETRVCRSPRKESECLVNLTESTASVPHQSRINNKLFNVTFKHDESINGDSEKGFQLNDSLIGFLTHSTEITIEHKTLHENCIFHHRRKLESATGENMFSSRCNISKVMKLNYFLLLFCSSEAFSLVNLASHGAWEKLLKRTWKHFLEKPKIDTG